MSDTRHIMDVHMATRSGPKGSSQLHLCFTASFGLGAAATATMPRSMSASLSNNMAYVTRQSWGT